MSILITGGAGFIGSHLVEALVKLDSDIIVLDNFSTGRFNLHLLEKYPSVTVVKGDIADWDTVNRLTAKSSKIFHLAAMNRAPRSIEDPLLSNEINITGTLYILEAARKHSVERIVFASSSSVYGRSEVFPRRENGETRPAHPYAVGKLASEYYCDIYHFLYGLNITSLRYFAVYGPRQSPFITYAAVIPVFIRNLIEGNPITIFGDGTQTRNFTFVEDTVRSTIMAMDSNKTSGKILNVASQREVSLNELLKIIEEISGQSIKVRYEDWRQGDAKRAVPDLALAKRIIGFVPETSIKEGVKRTYEWFKANPDYFLF
ncbi:MAG: NAD-dependent epimerase/dehydratase family protein [Candidatus Hodarchaeota archaeon]